MSDLVRLLSIAAALGVILVCAACGGGGTNEDDTAARRAIQQAAQDRAEAIVLKLSDFPNDWRASAHEEDADDANATRKCIGVDYSGHTIIGEAPSDDFAMGNAEINAEVQVLESDSQASDGYEQFAESMSGDLIEDCLQKAMEKEVEQGFSVGEIDVGELSFTAPADVEEADAWQIAVPVEVTSGTSEGLSATVYLDVIVMREGDTVVTLSAQDVLTPLDSTLRDDLLEAMASRMTEANASNP
jgi:hypothetical protein